MIPVGDQAFAVDVNQHIAPILALEILDMWKDEPQQRRSLAYALDREEWR